MAGGGDFVAQGIVKNVARPEGNITGFTNNVDTLGGKWLELLKEAAPNLTRAAFLPLGADNNPYVPSIAAAAQSLGLRLVTLPVSDAASIRAEIERFVAEPNGGVIPGPGLPLEATTEVIRLAQKYRFPVIYANPLYPAAGGLMSYSPDNLLDVLLGAAGYVDRVLRGAKVSELPVQFPTRFKLVINLKTAPAVFSIAAGRGAAGGRQDGQAGPDDFLAKRLPALARLALRVGSMCRHGGGQTSDAAG